MQITKNCFGYNKKIQSDCTLLPANDDHTAVHRTPASAIRRRRFYGKCALKLCFLRNSAAVLRTGYNRTTATAALIDAGLPKNC
jgi:hypothetical protein